MTLQSPIATHHSVGSHANRDVPFAAQMCNEPARVAALREYDVIEAPPDARLDVITRTAANLCATPIAAIAMIDETRLYVKSRYGPTADHAPRDIVFCSQTILSADPFVMPDASTHEIFRDNPCVTGFPHLRFYAGVPLLTPQGHAIGTLCVFDHVPRTIPDGTLRLLQTLGRQVMAMLELQKASRRDSARIAAPANKHAA